MNATLATTPLHAWHVAAGARLAEFAGYAMPIQYSSIVAEHQATRTAATVFDISHMGRLRFDGGRADRLLDHLLTRRVTDMQIGEVRYSLMCDESGGILDDVLVYCLESTGGDTYFLLVVNASNREKIARWIAPHLADMPDVNCRDVTDQTAMIAVQGPAAADIVRRLYKQASVAELDYYRVRLADQFGKPTIVSRTGYTGEDGFEIVVRGEEAVRVWENLLLAGRDAAAMPAGLGARDTLRLEAAMPLYGHEISETIDPYTAGLGRVVQLEGRSFIGSEQLRKLKDSPRLTKRVGVRFDGRRAAREGAALLDADNRQVGAVTSGSFSPTLGCPIAMAYVAADAATPGTAVTADVRGSRIPGIITALPFYRRTA